MSFPLRPTFRSVRVCGGVGPRAPPRAPVCPVSLLMPCCVCRRARPRTRCPMQPRHFLTSLVAGLRLSSWVCVCRGPLRLPSPPLPLHSRVYVRMAAAGWPALPCGGTNITSPALSRPDASPSLLPPLFESCARRLLPRHSLTAALREELCGVRAEEGGGSGTLCTMRWLGSLGFAVPALFPPSSPPVAVLPPRHRIVSHVNALCVCACPSAGLLPSFEHLPKGPRMIELGAGLGRFTGDFADIAAHVLAVDFIPSLIEQNRAAHGHRENVDFMCADATKIVLPPHALDFVFSNWCVVCAFALRMCNLCRACAELLISL